MSTEEKVAFVADARDEYGLSTALSVVELPKATWYYHQKHKVSLDEKYAYLRPILEEIAREYPEYGYRRTRKELAENYDYTHGKELIRKLDQRWALRILRSTQPPEPSQVRQAITQAGERANMVAQRDDIGLFEVLYTDFTELRFANGTRKAYLVPILGHISKLVFGWAVRPRANTETALVAWEKTKKIFEKLEISCTGLIVHHDQDPVYTGYTWTSQLLLEDKVQLSYALNGARDNPEMESFFSRFKSEGRSLFLGAETVGQLRHVVSQRMVYYTGERRHSSIGYQAPSGLHRAGT